MRASGPAAFGRSEGTPTVQRRATPLASGRELMLLAILAGVYGLWYSDDPRTDFLSLNIGGPAALMAILLLGAWQQIRIESRFMWAPLFWFRISSAVYFGFGSMVPYIANDATAVFLRTTYNFSEREAFKAGLIHILCIFTVLLTSALISSGWRGHRKTPAVRARGSQLLTLYFAVSMLLIGGYIRYVVLLPIALGMASFVPGAFGFLGNLYAIGLYLLILYGLRTSKLALFIAGGIILVDVWVALLTFAKTPVLMTLLFSCLAVLHDRLTFKRMLIGIVLIAGTYSQIAPIIGYGRDELSHITRDVQRGTFEQRVAILSSYTSREIEESDGLQSGLARLCYLDYATLIMSWYDTGQRGNTLDNLFYIFVPRLIWPDKPVISSVGSDLYLAATGKEGSASGSGVFSEAYWNLGWAGIPMLMIPYALILAYLSRYCVRIMTEERWIHLPAVLSAVYIGIRTDGEIVIDGFGAAVIVFAYILICNALETFFLHKSLGS